MRNLLKTMLAALKSALVLVWESGKFVLKAVVTPISDYFFGGGGEPELDEAQEAARLQQEQQAAQDAQRSAEAALEEAASLKVVARALGRGSEPDAEHLDQLSEPTRRYLALAPAAEIKRVGMMRVAQIQDLIDGGRLARRADEISGKQSPAPAPASPAPTPAA